jgi:hypothetical protein
MDGLFTFDGLIWRQEGNFPGRPQASARPGPPVPPLSLPLFRLRRLDEQLRSPEIMGKTTGNIWNIPIIPL